MIDKELDEIVNDDEWYESLDKKVHKNLKTIQFKEAKKEFYSLKKEADDVKAILLDYCKKHHALEKKLINAMFNGTGEEGEVEKLESYEEYIDFENIERYNNSQKFLLFLENEGERLGKNILSQDF